MSLCVLMTNRAASGGGGGGGGTAPYPLDDNGTMAAAFGAGFTPANAPAYQRVDWTVTNALTSPSTALPASPTTAPALMDLIAGTGKVGIGYTLPALTANPVASASPMYLQCIGWTGAAPGKQAWIQTRQNSGGNIVRFSSGPYGSLTDDFTETPGTLLNIKLGLVVDCDTGAVDYYMNGAHIGTGSATLTDTGAGQGYFLGLTMADNNDTISDVKSHQLVTDATDLATYGFPAGTKDIAGNVI